MLRRVKQFAYGLAYLLIIALVIWGVVSSGNRPGEVSEPGKEYLPVEVVRSPKFFQLDSGETSFLAEFGNPNRDAEVSFSYKFTVFGRSGEAIGEIRGNELLPAEAEEFVAGFADPSEEVRSVEVEVSNETYGPASDLFEGGVVVRDVATESADNRARITGVLKNESLLSLSRVRVIGVLADEFGFQLFAGSTVLENIGSFGEEEFEISVPVDGETREKMSASSTQVYVNLE